MKQNIDLFTVCYYEIVLNEKLADIYYY